MTILASKKIADFGAWAEQLIAESTGKEGKGLIPIEGEPLGDPAVYGNDRFFIDIRIEGEADAAHDSKLAAIEAAGHPVVRIVMAVARATFLDRNAASSHIHPIPTGTESPEESAEAYARELQAFYGSGRLDPSRPLFDMTR